MLKHRSPTCWKIGFLVANEGPPLHRAIWMERMDGEFPCTAWTIPGDVTEIDVHELIGEQVRRRLNRPEPVARIEDPRPHISRLHATREPVSTTRWLTINAHNLTVAFGIAEPFWCGLFLPRKALFDVRLDGDVDFLAGPLELEVDEDEWRLRLEEECRRHHIGVARSVVVHHCWMRAAEDGLLRWPPRLKLIAACEMKASWFDAEKGTWHATHVREGPRVKGQLELLLRFGLDRVGFLHLGATKPRAVESINSWFLAGHDAAIARKTMPFVFAPNEMPQCGYFQAVVGSVPFACEDLSGAGGRLTVHQESPALASPAQDWRGGLFQKLAEAAQTLLAQSVHTRVSTLWPVAVGHDFRTDPLPRLPEGIGCQRRASGLLKGPAGRASVHSLVRGRPNRDKLTFLTSPRSGFSEVCTLSHNPSGTASSKPASNRGWLRR